MEQPPATLVIQGVLRPAFNEEQTVIQKHLSSRHLSNGDINEAQELEENLEGHGRINHRGHESSSSKDGLNLMEALDESIPASEASFYRLEMIKVQLFTGNSHPVCLVSVLFCSLSLISLLHCSMFSWNSIIHHTPFSPVRMSSLSVQLPWPNLSFSHLEATVVRFLSNTNLWLFLWGGRDKKPFHWFNEISKGICILDIHIRMLCLIFWKNY